VSLAHAHTPQRLALNLLSFAWTPHGTYRDLELFVEYLGFTPMEAILSATALGGEIMMHPHELGKVLPGYYADLILVDGNPLEDIKLLTGHQNIDFVMIVRVCLSLCEPL
jgi:imidazolonepropionase-like amidohydrolase